MGLSGGKCLSANGGVLRSRTLAREVRRGLGLLIVRFSHLQVFAACAGALGSARRCRADSAFLAVEFRVSR